MSVHVLPSNTLEPGDNIGHFPSSSSEDDDDQNWDDWVSDSAIEQPCKSLFEDTALASAEEALAYDKRTFGFDLEQVCKRLSLDYHGRIRLINYIRANKPTPADISHLQGSESFLVEDKYLIPVLENDPLLQTDTRDWSDSEDQGDIDPDQRIKYLEKQLFVAKQELADYRSFVSQKLDISGLRDAINEVSNEPAPSTRDDDTHYFESYAANDIHAVMIQDKVRTSTYASFILRNPVLFENAIVLDVGCGTGILSLFAAKAGAKRVFAIDASDITDKAEKIVKDNGLEHVITVVRGKVEDISLPDGFDHVDIIISEWMGYALLYESMLDSVLWARDRFLKPEGGVMAPSQCRILLGLCDATEVYKERMAFWNDVYGFDLSAMAEDVYNDAVVDVVGSETLLCEPYVIKDLILSEIMPRQLDFVSSFTLVSTSDRKTKVNAFIVYFDIFFNPTGRPISPNTQAKIVKEEEPVVAEVWPVGGKSAMHRRQSQGREKDNITSFSTSPKSIPTHWKQTIFLLREPINIDEGFIVSGSFHCKKSKDNSRELDVEIHYSVQETAESPIDRITVQLYKVR